jgi:probable selenium-dependent hydroxylase accessory protein YqeC
MDLAGTLGLEGGELVAFVGAGGKKTAMARLVEQAGTHGLRVGYTTTTHTPPPEDVPLVLAGAADLPEALAEAGSPVAFAAERVPDPERAAEKVRGFDADTLDRVFASDEFDWLLVKADGARRREFKAPGPGEPVVPAATTHLVPVASVRAVGRPLDAPAVHRSDRVAAIADVGVGDTVTTETVGRVLAHEAGGLKGAPAGARVTPVVNKADTLEQRAQAREAVRAALASSDRLDRGLVTSFGSGYCEVLGE